jgi:hypothetical protein
MGCGRQSVVVGQKPLVKRKCETARCRDPTASFFFVAEIRGEVLAHFHAVTLNVTLVFGIDCVV